MELLSIKPGVYRVDGMDLIYRDREDILIQHNEAGALSRFDEADLMTSSLVPRQTKFLPSMATASAQRLRVSSV